MSPDEAEFVDRMGLFFETLGAGRTMGRVYGWLMICDPPQQSLSGLAATLSVSKASISTVARQLQEGGMIERLPSGQEAVALRRGTSRGAGARPAERGVRGKRSVGVGRVAVRKLGWPSRPRADAGPRTGRWPDRGTRRPRRSYP